LKSSFPKRDGKCLRHRHGFAEETHFTIAYSPVPDDDVPSGIGGVLATVQEITEKVIGERRIRVLRDLGTRAVEAKTAEEACLTAAGILARHDKDIPFALLYLLDEDRKRARLAGTVGVGMGKAISSRIEAGRIQATYEPTDLRAFTEDLASVFRSAIERAGMRLVVDCAPVSAPVYVDRDMWEKVVLNLLSNAFKFTLKGEIGVSLRCRGGGGR
jgi:hypothetical protein